MNPLQQLQTFRANTEAFIGEKEILERLQNGKRLRVKLGVDPTRPDLTLGHMVVLNKLRQFQDLGHQAILIIGDFTTRIGDPSGRSSTRPLLSEAEISANAATYLEQAGKILNIPQTEVRRNSEWFASMSFLDALALSRQMTVARMLERDDFAKRHASQTPISLIEFLYPLLQGRDSVEVHADIELGGSDQIFNMLVGRQLQKDAAQPEQAVLAMPLLVGLDGSRKMSKSYGNYIAFNHSPKDMFGCIMSIADETMWTYYRLLLETNEENIRQLHTLHPMEVKKRLATAIVARFYGETTAANEREQFEKVFSRHELRDDIPEFSLSQLWDTHPDGIPLIDALAATKIFVSKKEIRRLFDQNAVRINNQKADNPTLRLSRPLLPSIIQAGKRTFIKFVE
ncbi:MAG: tyrosine--tRNA ligase [Puniceicoccales bacterium]|jgi:tyrosyl-tRNA synthetase|nr:tyrosine--tRNA ligase [Puniceicoccales bacterium]